MVYCNHCGGPQIFLSEELQAQLQDATRAYEERNTPVEAEPGATEDIVPAGSRWNPLRRGRRQAGQVSVEPWTLGVHYALLSAGVALALGLLSLLIPPISLLTLLWVVSAPMLTVVFYNGRGSAVPAAASGFAARLGLLTGVLVSVCCAVVFTLSLVLTRFVLHSAATLDAQLAATFAQQRTLVLARLGTAAQPTLDLFQTPDYRVGLLFSVLTISSVFYLLLSTVTGGIAGLVLSRRRP